MIGFQIPDSQLESLVAENKDLKKAIKSVKSLLDRTLDDYETLKKIHESFKEHYAKMRNEKIELEQRLEATNNEKREEQINAEAIVRSLGNQLNEKIRDIEVLQQKALPSLESDVQRMRLMNEMEAPHRLELEAKQMEIDRLIEKQYELKRQLELAKAKHEATIAEAARDIKQIKEKHKIELKDAALEVNIGQERANEIRKYKEDAKVYKTEAEDLRMKLLAKDEQLFNLTKKLDLEKEERSEQIEQLVREMDELRDHRRQQQTLNEKQQEHIVDLEGEIKRTAQLSRSSSQGRLKSENSSSNNENNIKKPIYQEDGLQEMKENESLIRQLQQRIQESKGRLQDEIKANREQEKKMEEQIDRMRKEKRDLENEFNKTVAESTDKIAEEKRKTLSLQNQLAQLQKDNNALQDTVRELQSLPSSFKENKNLANSKQYSSALQIESLSKKNIALKEKLSKANQKIMELLSEKILEKKRSQDFAVMKEQNQILKNIQDIPTYQTYNTQPPYSNYNTQPGYQNSYPISTGGDPSLNLTTPIIRTAHTSIIPAPYSKQSTGNFQSSQAIETELNNQRDRLNQVKDHVDDMYRISNKQFYRPYP